MQNITGKWLGTHWRKAPYPCMSKRESPIHPRSSPSPRPASWKLSLALLFSDTHFARWHESLRTPLVPLMLSFFPSLPFRFITLVCSVPVSSPAAAARLRRLRPCDSLVAQFVWLHSAWIRGFVATSFLAALPPVPAASATTWSLRGKHHGQSTRRYVPQSLGE